jgi:hypothetical protein
MGSLGFEPRTASVLDAQVSVPQAGILDQSSGNTPKIQGKTPETRRRPQTLPYTHRYRDQIQKTIELAKTEGKAETTLANFYHRLNQLDRFADLMNPTEVKTAIAYAKLANSSKSSFVLAYQWFAKANGLTWEKPKYKWSLPIPIIPTTESVNRIISASTKRYATIFTILAKTGAEGEELHRTHRSQIDTTRNNQHQGHKRTRLRLIQTQNTDCRDAQRIPRQKPARVPIPRSPMDRRDMANNQRQTSR